MLWQWQKLCTRLGVIGSWVWRKAYHQPYEPYRKLEIYESSVLTIACWGADVLSASIWGVGMTAKHIQEQGKDSPEDTKWYCYSRSDWKEFWFKLRAARNNVKMFISICGHLRKGLAASAPGFQHFLNSGGKAELTAVRDILSRMLHKMIWYLRARCLPKASAVTCDWERLGRFHNKFPPTTTAAALVLMQRKYSRPWPSWLPSVLFCTECIKTGDEKARCLIPWETHRKCIVSVLALEKAVQYLILCFATRPTSRRKGRRDGHAAAHSPSGAYPCGASWVPWWYSAGKLCCLPDEEPQVICESPTAPCSGAIIWVILCLILTPATHPSGEDSLECGPAASPPSSSAEPRLCSKNKRVQNLLYKELEMSGGGGREVSSHNILSRGVCQQTKRALWKRFSFLRCWIGLNLLCSYCLSLDSRIIGYKTMKFCPNVLCCTALQKEVHLCLLS